MKQCVDGADAAHAAIDQREPEQDQERGQDETADRGDRAREAAQAQADQREHVRGGGAWEALSQRRGFEECALANPASAPHQTAIDVREHRKAAAEPGEPEQQALAPQRTQRGRVLVGRAWPFARAERCRTRGDRTTGHAAREHRRSGGGRPDERPCNEPAAGHDVQRREGGGDQRGDDPQRTMSGGEHE